MTEDNPVREEKGRGSYSELFLGAFLILVFGFSVGLSVYEIIRVTNGVAATDAIIAVESEVGWLLMPWVFVGFLLFNRMHKKGHDPYRLAMIIFPCMLIAGSATVLLTPAYLDSTLENAGYRPCGRVAERFLGAVPEPFRDEGERYDVWAMPPKTCGGKGGES